GIQNESNCRLSFSEFRRQIVVATAAADPSARACAIDGKCEAGVIVEPRDISEIYFETIGHPQCLDDFPKILHAIERDARAGVGYHTSRPGKYLLLSRKLDQISK